MGLAAVVILVLANGFFVAAEFALVSVRRSRVAELVAEGRANALLLRTATDRLDAHLAATQFGITLSSLALGWVGEPAIAHLIEPALRFLPDPFGTAAAHGIAVAVAFALVTTLHIVFGELAPKSLALQRGEATALVVVRPLAVFLMVFRPAIHLLNWLGNSVLRLVGLRPGGEEEALHSPQELKILVAASQKAGLLDEAQSDVVGRVFGISELKARSIMTPRLEVEWIDVGDPAERILETLRESRHEQFVVSRIEIDDIVGVVRKQDLLAQVLTGGAIDVAAATADAVVVHESLSLVALLQMFRERPVRLAVVVDEYGGLEGVVTQTDLLEAIAGDIAGSPDEEPGIERRGDGTVEVAGRMPVAEAFELFGLPGPPARDVDTLAGFAVSRFGRIPAQGDGFDAGGWSFVVHRMDGRRIDRILARKPEARAA